MPCHSLQEDVDDALLLRGSLIVPTRWLTGPRVRRFVDCVSRCGTRKLIPGRRIRRSGTQGRAGQPFSGLLARANLKPRLFMATWYYHANIMDYLVVGSSNKDELYVGYSTKYGDSGVDIMALANLTKGEVKAMAAYMGVPRKILRGCRRQGCGRARQTRRRWASHTGTWTLISPDSP